MALSPLSSNSQRIEVSASVKDIIGENLDPKSLHHKIEVAKEEHAFVEKIAIADGENEEHGELVVMLHDISHSNLKHAEEAFKEGEYADASRHIENVHKAAHAAASYSS